MKNPFKREPKYTQEEQELLNWALEFPVTQVLGGRMTLERAKRMRKSYDEAHEMLERFRSEQLEMFELRCSECNSLIGGVRGTKLSVDSTRRVRCLLHSAQEVRNQQK